MTSGETIVRVAPRYLAPAKVNLFLHVVGRRSDGYHLIQSAMRLVDLADELTIEVRADGKIVREGSNSEIAEDEDLVVRAARMLQRAADVGAGASIAIDKRIPVGGGLGGGSSDAATVLLALNRLWRLDWSRAQLAAIGLALGADVPFFIEGRDAFVEGIGELVTAVELPEGRLVIVHPDIAVPTASIFSDPELTRDTPPITIAGFSEAVRAGGAGLRNDLEPVASRRFEAVAEALRWLDGPHRGGISRARMSGSGSCVFRAFASESDAAQCAASVPPPWSAWNVGTLASHPMRGFATN